MMLQPYLKQLKAVFKEVGFTWEPNKYPQKHSLSVIPLYHKMKSLVYWTIFFLPQK